MEIPSGAFALFHDPVCPLPKEITEINGITEKIIAQRLKGMPVLPDVRHEIAKLLA